MATRILDMYADSDSDFSSIDGGGHRGFNDSDDSDFEGIDDDFFRDGGANAKFDLFKNTAVYDNAGKMDDMLSIGSDDDFRPDTNPKMFGMFVKESDAQSIGSDEDFHPLVPGAAKKRSLLKSEGEIDDYLGGGDDEIESIGEGEEEEADDFGDSGGAGDGGERESRALIAQGLRRGTTAGAAVRGRHGMTRADFQRGREANEVVEQEEPPEREGKTASERVAGKHGVSREDYDRIKRSSDRVSNAWKAAKTTAEREAVEERVLGELDEVMEDIRRELTEEKSFFTPLNKSVFTTLKKRQEAIQASINRGLSLPQMAKAVSAALELEARIEELRRNNSAKKITRAVRRAAEQNKAEVESSTEDEGNVAEKGAVPMARAEFSVGAGKVKGIPEGIKKWKFTHDGVRITSGTAPALLEKDPESTQKEFALQKVKRMKKDADTKAGKRVAGKARGRHASSGGGGGAGLPAAFGGGAASAKRK